VNNPTDRQQKLRQNHNLRKS